MPACGARGGGDSRVLPGDPKADGAAGGEGQAAGCPPPSPCGSPLLLSVPSAFSFYFGDNGKVQPLPSGKEEVWFLKLQS